MSAPSAMDGRLVFRDWSPWLAVSNEGRHIYGFETAFPLTVFGHKFAYRNLVPNYHDYLEIGYVCGGSGLLCVGDREYPLDPGDVMLIGSDEVHAVQATGGAPLHFLSLFFLTSLLFPPSSDDASFDLTRPFFEGSRNVLGPDEIDHKSIFRALYRMYRLATDRPQYHRLLLRLRLLELLLKILQHFERYGLLGQQPGAGALDRRSRIHRLNSVFALVEGHYADRISLDQVADMCHMSRTYFCRFFHNVTGTSFVEYLNRFRVNRAKGLMVGGDLTMSQVAYQVGFSNLGYFYRTFHKYADLSPGEFASRYHR